MLYKKIPQIETIPRWWLLWFWEANYHWNLQTRCLEYNNPLKRGYPRVILDKETFPAHRMAYFLYYQKDPEELLVRHLCHNRNCANPLHLTLGTHWQNSQDMVRAGRSQTGESHWMKRLPERFEEWKKNAKGKYNLPENGENHPCTKLKTEQVREIKTRLANGEGNRELAEEFGVTHSNISAIALGKSWGHIESPTIEKNKKWMPKLTPENVREIRRLAEQGQSQASIARQFQMGETSIFKVITRKSWKHIE